MATSGRQTGIAETLRSFDVSVASDAEVAALAADIYEAARKDASALLQSPITAPLGQRLLQSRASLADVLAAWITTRLRHPGGEDALRELFVVKLSSREATRAQ